MKSCKHLSLLLQRLNDLKYIEKKPGLLNGKSGFFIE